MNDITAGTGPIWLIGGGNMGGAMLRGWLDAGLPVSRFTVIDPMVPALAARVTVLPAAPSDGPPPAIVILAVKPQLLDAVAPAIAPLLGDETLLFSILAGIEIGALARRFPRHRAIVRAMPNMGVAIGKGVMALCAAPEVDDGVRDEAEAFARPLGLVEWITDENLFDAVTAVCGCGPAFLFRFIDAIAGAGTVLGIPKAQAARLAMATVEGAALLAADNDENPAVLADRVASPGGSTRAGLNVLDAEEALRRLVYDTLDAATRRNTELAQTAR